MQERTIGSAEAGQRLNKYLQRILPEAGNGFIYKMLRKKNITLNDKRAEGNEVLAKGDFVKLFLSEDTIAKFSGKPMSAILSFAKRSIPTEDILFEDEHICVVYKPAGLLSQKDTPQSESINEQILQYLLETKQISGESLKNYKPSICNRLDRNTAGLVLFAKTLAAGQGMNACLKERHLDKFYFAYVIGVMEGEREDCSYLTKDELTNKVTISKSPINSSSSEIHTKFYPVANNGRVTLVKILLLTGKSHQIRGVLQSIGHPILGDPKYMSEDRSDMQSLATQVTMEYRRKYHVQGQQLVAYAYRFPKELPEALHGLAGKTICSKLPKTFDEILTEEKWNIRKEDPYGILEV